MRIGQAHARLLVVDGDQRVLHVLRDILRRTEERYDIRIASDGERALDICRRTPFDMVITEVELPHVDGIALTRAVRHIAPETLVVWITSCGCGKLRDAAKRLWVHRCLEKPLSIDVIREAVRDALTAVVEAT